MTDETLDVGPTFQKIPGPWKRYSDGPLRNQLIPNAWSSPELEVTASIPGWTMTEKMDGTNIRVHHDGFSVSFGGRTNKAQIPLPLANYLSATFHSELFEQQFGETPVTVYGEGIGPKIQARALPLSYPGSYKERYNLTRNF